MVLPCHLGPQTAATARPAVRLTPCDRRVGSACDRGGRVGKFRHSRLAPVVSGPGSVTSQA